MSTTLATKPVTRATIRKYEDTLEGPPVGELHRAVHKTSVNYHLQEVTGDKARAVAGTPGIMEDKPAFASPWHYHECGSQLAFVLEGSAEIAFSENVYFRVKKGELALIPGHVVHDVRNASADYNVIELTFPGSFSTIDAPAPPQGAATKGVVWGQSAAIRQNFDRGLATYAYPVPADNPNKMRVEHQWRTRLDPFIPGSLKHDDSYRLLYVVQGWRDVEIEGETTRLGVGDMLVLPRGAECQDVGVSQEHTSLVVSLLD